MGGGGNPSAAMGRSAAAASSDGWPTVATPSSSSSTAALRAATPATLGGLESLESSIAAKMQRQVEPPLSRGGYGGYRGLGGASQEGSRQTLASGATRPPTQRAMPPGAGSLLPEDDNTVALIDVGFGEPNPVEEWDNSPQVDVVGYAETASSSYPDNSAMVFDNDASLVLDEVGGIQAFVAETIVDATGVAVVMSEEEEEKYEKKKYLKKGLIIAFIIAAIATAIAVPVALKFINTPTVITEELTEEPTEPPTLEPTHSPSFAPTRATFVDMMTLITPVSGSAALSDPDSPQAKALDWIANRDPLQRSVEDVRFLQRYVCAVFYYSTGGDEWSDCSEGDQVCRDPQSESFLSGSDECSWFGNTCKENKRIYKIYHGQIFGVVVVTTISLLLVSLLVAPLMSPQNLPPWSRPTPHRSLPRGLPLST